MAIRPLKCITELKLLSLSKSYKSCREITNSHIFCNLLISGMEYLLIYCRGHNLEEFFNSVLSSITETSSEDFRENHSDSFDDLSELFSKKKNKNAKFSYL